MSPTTDDEDKYNEQQNQTIADDPYREDGEQTLIWNTIFSCFGWIALAIIVLALVIALTR